MLGIFRRVLNTWPAKVFFMLLVGTFVLWGVGDVVRNIGSDGTAVATVAGVKIEAPEVQDAYRRQMAQVQRMFGGKTEPTPEIRRGVAAQAVERLVTDAALRAGAVAMGLGVSDDALRQAVFDIPNFRGANGQFDRNTFLSLLQQNGLTEARFLDLVRSDLLQKQLLGAARVGTVAPDELLRAVYAFQHETRTADAVMLPFAGAPAPAAPTEAQLTRWYENNMDKYSSPELRHIHAVVLSPESVSADIQITDEDLKAAYDARAAQYNQPEKRTVRVLVVSDEAKAAGLAEKWRGGMDWPDIQAAAKAEGGSPVELVNAAEGEFPSAELGAAVFAAAPGAIAGPVKGALGYYLVNVTGVTPGVSKPFDSVKDELRGAVLADKAADLIADRAGKIDDLLAGGAKLEELPADLGLKAVTGTLDAQGRTASGVKAPIPGSEALRQALIAAAFQARIGDPAKLIEAPKEPDGGQAYYAVDVDEITPPAPRPMDEVADAVRADWTRDAIRHAQEEAAAKILTDVKQGRTLAAAAAGLAVTRLAAATRAAGGPGVPAALVEPLFALHAGEPTMVETPDGFVVAVLAAIDDPDPKADPVGFGAVKDALTKAMADDTQGVLILALRDRGKPVVNQAALQQIAQPE